MSKTTQSNPATTAPEAPVAEAKAPSAPKEIEITSSNTFKEVLEYDQKGYRIMFACEKGKFLRLKEDEIRQLSSFTKVVYGAMQNQNRVVEAEDPDWEQIKLDLKVGDTRGSARARLAVKGSKETMETRFFRPDNIGTAEAKGWKPAKVGDYKVAGSHDGHVSIKAHGVDELVLFERPKSFRAEAEKQRQERKKAQVEAEKRSYLRETAQTGYRPLMETEVSSKGFKDVT